jgi:hypothetical protein
VTAVPTARPLRPDQALVVLAQLTRELAHVDSATRAIVGLRVGGDDHVELVDVDLLPNGILEVGDDVAGLVVVTAEELAADDEMVEVQQLVCVLPDGTEVGTSRAAGPDAEDAVPVWRTDQDPDDAAEALRPRDPASNTARRAFGLPSLVDELPPEREVCARAWLLTVATAALQRFDAPDGPHEVEPSELAEVAARELPDALGPDGPPPTWDELHAAAAGGHLEVGPFSVDREHARWLDPLGLAQVLDRTLPPLEELLGTLQVVGDDDLLGWAIDWLTEKEWYEAASAGDASASDATAGADADSDVDERGDRTA